MSGDTVERRMLEVAQEIVLNNGLSISFDHFRMDRMIADAGVPKSSVYRRWPTKEAFLADFLPRLAQPLSGSLSAYDEMTQTIALQVIQANVPRLATREGRIAVAREAIRRAVDRNYEAMTTDNRWRAYEVLVLAATNSAAEPLRDVVNAAVRNADRGFVSEMASFYEQMLPWVQARFKPGITSQNLAATGAAVVEGLVVRSIQNPDLAEAKVPGPAIDGGTTEWSLAALGFYGIVWQCVDFLDNDGQIVD